MVGIASEPSYTEAYGDENVGNGISADGSTVVGEVAVAVGDGYGGYTYVPFAHTQDGGIVTLTPPCFPYASGSAEDASADGARVVGTVSPCGDTPSEAFLWEPGTGLFLNLTQHFRDLGLLPADAYLTDAVAISDDGTTIAGNGSWAAEAYPWVATIPLTPTCGSTDFDGDGDEGTDADIEAFFSAIGGGICPTGTCGSTDFDGDGDEGTDADIESFFRRLGGGPC